ncbi:MAG: dephospho-CoA kinase [Chloroherpetonaceae bacterium]|nr:dephospho-CoA kinase [Chloroherpetonaceae bacterium]MDW8437707.1 dephospho-CoA kinase [Chloroherpetonaceae bacterium]
MPIKRIGVTGGIGTGKTTVCDILRQLGCEIFSADLVAKRLQETDDDIIAGIKEIFGEAIYEDGVPNRKRIADIVFRDEEKLKRLNALVHPKVFRAFEEAARRAEAAGKAVIAKEAAILFESGGEKGLDAVIVVASDLNKRIERLKARGLSDAEIRARMSRQLPQEELLKRADVVIWNDGSLEALEAETQRALDVALARIGRNA